MDGLAITAFHFEFMFLMVIEKPHTYFLAFSDVKSSKEEYGLHSFWRL
jgi:hypothetical protein